MAKKRQPPRPRMPLVVPPELGEQLFYLVCEMREFFFTDDEAVENYIHGGDSDSPDAKLYNRGTELIRRCRQLVPTSVPKRRKRGD